MRIGIDALSLKPGRTGGGETYIVNLLKALSRSDAGHHFEIFCLGGVRELCGITAPNMAFRTVSFPGPEKAQLAGRMIYEQTRLPGAVKRLGIDCMLFLGNIASVFCPCPSILTIHDLWTWFYKETFPGVLDPFTGKVLPQVVRVSARRATRISASSHFTKSEIIRFFRLPSSKVEVVHLGFRHSADPQPGLPPPGTDAEGKLPDGVRPPFLLNVGNQHLHKNLHTLVDAFSEFKRSTGLPHQLVIAGMAASGTPLLQERIRVANSVDIVTIGVVPKATLDRLYRDAAAFVFPSRYEGFGFPPLEAMARGVPVIAARSSSITEVVGDAALLFEPTDVPQMASAIRRILTDSALAASLKKMGFRHSGPACPFTWERTADAMLGLVRSVVEQKSGKNCQ